MGGNGKDESSTLGVRHPDNVLRGHRVRSQLEEDASWGRSVRMGADVQRDQVRWIAVLCARQVDREEWLRASGKEWEVKGHNSFQNGAQVVCFISQLHQAHGCQFHDVLYMGNFWENPDHRQIEDAVLRKTQLAPDAVEALDRAIKPFLRKLAWMKLLALLGWLCGLHVTFGKWDVKSTRHGILTRLYVRNCPLPLAELKQR